MGPVGAQSSIVHEQQVAISVGGDVSFEKATLRFGWIDSSLQSRGVVREGALERSPRRKAASSDCRAESRAGVDRLPQLCLETLRAPAAIENELFVGLRPGQRPDEIDSLPARQAGT